MMRLMSKPTATYFPFIQALLDSTFHPRYTKISRTLQAIRSSLLPALTLQKKQISHFINSHPNPLVLKLPSYVKDTTHFLQKLDDLKELPPGSLLVTLDASSLYTNIPHKEGIEACRSTDTSSVPLTYFLPP